MATACFMVRAVFTMKKAVAILRPRIEAERVQGSRSAGKVVLATVKGDVHDIGKNIVAVVMACNGYEVVDLGVMVPADVIVRRAIEEKADLIGLSGLITPSLDEMAGVARELQRAGLHIPLLIGGATTSDMHTALRIVPEYDAPVIHLKDASQNAPVAAKLLNPATRDAYVREVYDHYRDIVRRREQAEPALLTLDEARANRLNLFGDVVS